MQEHSIEMSLRVQVYRDDLRGLLSSKDIMDFFFIPKNYYQSFLINSTHNHTKGFTDNRTRGVH